MISSKLPNTGTTIFSIMSALAQKHDAINLSQGFPSFSPDPNLFDAAFEAMKSGKNQYAPTNGVPALCEVISDKAQKLYGAHYDPTTEVTITSGATEALYDAITAVVRPGDKVLIFEPAYDSYSPAVQLAGGIPIHCRLEAPKFNIPWDSLEETIEQCRLIILNSPHNPTGSILSEEDLNELHRILQNTATLILSDEVYEHIVFDDEKHASVSRHEKLRERAFVVGSLGKTYHTTGWKIGSCLAPKRLSEEFRKIHQYVTFASPTPLQCAFAEALKEPRSYLDVPAFFQEKRDYFLKLLENTPFDPLPCKGTYFQLASYKRISDESDTYFCERLTREYGVAAIPLSPFHHDQFDAKMVRFCFAKDLKTLENAAKRLQRLS